MQKIKTFVNRYLDLPSPYAVALLIALAAWIVVFVTCQYQTLSTPETYATGAPEAPAEVVEPVLEGIPYISKDGDRLREVTAYNVGDPNQTDSSPCIGAVGSKFNLCDLVAAGEKIVATNELPLWSKVKINGEVYTVMDRMALRFKHRYDIAMPLEKHAEAITFGVKVYNVVPL